MQEQELVNAIAKLVVEQLKNVDVCDPKDRIPVGISARHVHLSQADLETLFGKGYELHKKKDLMGGQYAAQECVLEQSSVPSRMSVFWDRFGNRHRWRFLRRMQ